MERGSAFADPLTYYKEKTLAYLWRFSNNRVVTCAGLGLLINFQQPSTGDFALIDASSFNINLCIPS
jgi:hypothetical protein